MAASKETLDEIALTRQEYDSIVEKLDREPTQVELGMFGAMWSEHCGYKHSKLLLRTFPSESPRLLAAPGQENAGVIDIGDGLAAVVKVESHNHPSAVDPYQGAATGVGGIVRDILAMGARPVALLNSLRFGPLTSARTKYLFQGVVSGISGYGNCIGVPDVGGEIGFDASYSGNPLVNVLCLGIVPIDGLVKSTAGTPGNLLVLVGSETGRDGIHGASGLASRTFENDLELRPTVQVGNPFMEKVLIESCLEVARADLIEGMQDLGAAGLTSSVVESTSKGGTGFDLDVSKVPCRESGMTAYEVMLSESQERMVLFVPPENLKPVQEIMAKWDIPCTVVGEVTAGGMARIFDGETQVGVVPGLMLTHAPLYELSGEKPQLTADLQAYDLDSVPLPNQAPGDVLLQLLTSPNISSKEWVYRQYDHQVQTNTVLGPGQGDAALLWVKGTSRALALSTDGTGRMTYLDPYVGGAMAVAEACRNVACTGAKPLAITDCLNFGNPERPEVAYQMKESVRGMVDACRALEVPVVSGNVSLYNETRGESVYPTPVVGAIGLMENMERRVGSAFQNEGDLVVLLGASKIDGDATALAGSEYLESVHGLVAGQPSLDLALETGVQRVCLRLVEEGMLHSAHDCAEGGLAVAIAESAVQGGLGFQAIAKLEGRWDAALFGETASRIIISLDSGNLRQVEEVCREEGVPYTSLGTVGGKGFTFSDLLDLPLEDLENAWRNGLERALER